MKLSKANRAFMLVEAVIAMALVSVSAVAIISGLTFCVRQIWFTRDNATATQVLVDKTELIRSRGWNGLEQLPYSFHETFNGVLFDGTIEAFPVAFTNRYSRHVRLVRTHIIFHTGDARRERTWDTFVSFSGYGNLYDSELPRESLTNFIGGGFSAVLDN